MRTVMIFFAGLTIYAPAALAQRPIEVAPNAPADRPTSYAFWCQWRAATKAMEPYIALAKSTYPAAKARFLAGLPPRHTFFVTTRIQDLGGGIEQVFIAVDTIVDGQIRGRIASDILRVRGFTRGQVYQFPEGQLIDWMVARPDGSEDGNVVGKFLDTYQPPPCAGG